MSRIGKTPITIPTGVTVSVSKANVVTVKGTLGELTQQVDPDISLDINEGEIQQIGEPEEIYESPNNKFVSFGVDIVSRRQYTLRFKNLETQEIYPEKEKIVTLHNSQVPIFEKYGIERQIKTSFGKTVSMSKGAYLVIEHTEALHVIDVNSGNRSNKAGSQEETALEVNLIAASEIARQLQLRDMGGIIVVDFIDMHNADNRNKLYQHLKEAMSFDRTKHKILPPSKFGLVQITRQRVRPELSIKTTETDPNGNGQQVEAPIVLLDKIEADLEKYLYNLKSDKSTNKKIQLHIHPFIAAYLTKGVNSIRFKWYLKHKKWISIIPRDAYTYLHYEFISEDEKSVV